MDQPTQSGLAGTTSELSPSERGSDGVTGQTQRPVSPTFSCLSAKSTELPAILGGEDGSPGQRERSASPAHSSLSLKSMELPPILGDKTASPNPRVEFALDTHPQVTLLYKTQPNTNCPVLPDDILQRVKKDHKVNMIKRFEYVCEGNINPGHQTPLNKIFTPLYITEGQCEKVSAHEVRQIETSRRQTQGIQIDCNNIFKPLCEADKDIRIVLTRGVAGIGKTVSVQKFILDWAENKTNQEIDFIFVLPFRELNLIHDSQFSFHQLLSDFHPSLEHLSHTKNIYEGYNLVIIFDGLDESRLSLNFSSDQAQKIHDVTQKTSVGILIANLIQGNLLPSAHVWITSRPAAAGQIPSQFISRVTEVRGFTDQQKNEYFRKAISDQTQADKIISHIKASRSLHIICHIPVVCWISSVVFQEIYQNNRKEPQTLTEIFIHFLIIQMDKKRQKLGEMEDGAPSNKILEANKDVILRLAALAFNQLEKGNLLFYEQDLQDCGISVTEATVYSGLCTELFRTEFVFRQKKVFCFVHLSIQEFLSALHAFHSYVNKNFKALKSLLTGWERQHILEALLKDAVDKSLESENGHWDLFVRFLLGLSLESNQRLLQGLLTHVVSSSESIEETIKYTKEIIRYKDIKERCMNLMLCLLEMNDRSLHTEIKEYLESGKDLLPSHCSVLAYMILVSEDVLDELDLQKYTTTSEGQLRLIEAVGGCRTARLIGCHLTKAFLKTMTSALHSETSQLRNLNLSYNYLRDLQNELLVSIKSEHCKLETLTLNCCELKEEFCASISSLLKSGHTCLKNLDLSNNDLCDKGVEQLSKGLVSPNCKIEVLRLSGCLVSEKGCEALASALESNPFHLRELDLSYNHPSETELSRLSSLKQNKDSKLKSLIAEHCGDFRLKPGLRKYACELTMDPNTPHRDITLSKRGTVAKRGTEQPHPAHPDQFEVFEQVLCCEGLTGRYYWEAEWSHKGATMAVSYRDIERKGGQGSQFGSNDKSWSLMCCESVYTAKHNGKEINIPVSPANRNCIGVYLDWSAGTLSFYRVFTDKHVHLHTFSSTFTEPLYPGFGLEYDSSVSLCEIN